MQMQVLDEQRYGKLLSKTLPRIIQTEEENERYIDQLKELDGQKSLTPEENQLAALLTLLIQDFEEKHYGMPRPATPLDILQHLMDVNGLKQADLVGIFGTKSIVSEVLSGKRELSKTHIQRLSQRFSVSPELFFSPA